MSLFFCLYCRAAVIYLSPDGERQPAEGQRAASPPLPYSYDKAYPYDIAYSYDKAYPYDMAYSYDKAYPYDKACADGSLPLPDFMAQYVWRSRPIGRSGESV